MAIFKGRILPGGGVSMAQLFWARIKDIKAILRYKNFKSADQLSFEDTTKTKNQHTIKFDIGGVQKCKIIFVIYKIRLF